MTDMNGTLGKILLWVCQGLVLIVFYFLSGIISELKGRVNTLETTRYDMALQIVAMQGEQARYSKDIGELKGGLAGVEKAVQALTVALERQQRGPGIK